MGCINSLEGKLKTAFVMFNMDRLRGQLDWRLRSDNR